MTSLLALALAAWSGVAAQLPPAPLRLWQVAWQRQVVPPTLMEWKPRELGGPAVDPVTGYVVVGTRDGWVRAFDPDGTLVWLFEAKGRFEAPAGIDGDTVYAASTDGRLYALELGSGKLRWSYNAQEELGTTPVVAGDLVLMMTLQDTLIAVDAKTGAWRWHHRREQREGFTIYGAAAAVVADGFAIGAYSDGFVAALDLATGTTRWERRIAPAGDFMDVDGLRVQSGRLYAAAYSGAVYALDLRTGEQVWELRTPTPSRVTVGAGVVVAVTNTQVIGISPIDGKVRWTAPLDGTPAGAAVLAGGMLAVPNTKALLWLDPASGRLLRRFDPGTGVSAPVAGTGRRVYVLSNGGDLVALDVA